MLRRRRIARVSCGCIRAQGAIPRRNLFSPNRIEPAIVARVEIGVKPIVYGVVVDGPQSRAYLEDSTTKGMVGYAVDARLAGGRLQTVRSDRVLIARPSGVLEVLLADPATPRPASGGVATAAGSRVSPAAAVFPPGGVEMAYSGPGGRHGPRGTHFSLAHTIQPLGAALNPRQR